MLTFKCTPQVIATKACCKAVMAANIFHVEFGLNETELTQALESCRYDLAERLIRETTSASYLDEGMYDQECVTYKYMYYIYIYIYFIYIYVCIYIYIYLYIYIYTGLYFSLK